MKNHSIEPRDPCLNRAAMSRLRFVQTVTFPLHKRSATALFLGTLALLAGKGARGETYVKRADGQFAMGRLGGKVMGGQLPITGAVIQLYAVGSNGYGSAATPLFPDGAVMTDAAGNWSVNGYTCPAGNPQVYVTCKGGNSGYGGNNPNILLTAALGDCLSTYNKDTIDITETSTVATVWAFAPFMTGPANVGSTQTNTAGLVNAAADVNVLVDITSGATPGPAAPAGATVPKETINTLANVLAYCTNSTGGSAGDGTPCGQLFSFATPPGGMAPTELMTAALNIARNPAHNVGAIFNLAGQAPPAPPYGPNLNAAPNDYTLAVGFSGGSMNNPAALAVDASSNVWVVSSANSSVTELSHLGAVINTASDIVDPSAITIDPGGTIWIAGRRGSNVSRLSSSSGSLLAGSPITGASLNAPTTIAIDGSGNAWVSNADASVTQISSDGTLLQNYKAAGVTSPVGIGANPH